MFIVKFRLVDVYMPFIVARRRIEMKPLEQAERSRGTRSNGDIGNTTIASTISIGRYL
jgi:hypothetical protein